MGKLKHGHTANKRVPPEYTAWRDMRQRCNNPSNHNYKKYGERGIKIGDEFEEFEDFLEWMGERPDNMSLDRIDNDGDYVAGNVRWASDSVQQRNKNKQSNNRSGYTGVSKDKTNNKWVAYISIKGKNYHLGRFDYPWTAHYVYENHKAMRKKRS